MSIIEIIKKRRSIRSYQNKKIPDNLIRKLIDAARFAPSGYNAQPQKYLIIKDGKKKQELKDNEVFKQEFVYRAPVIIVCCGDPQAYLKEKLEPDFDDSYEIQAVRDVAIAAQNLVLRATELELGTCYIGWVHKNRLKKALKIPNNYVIPFVITLGYPAKKPTARFRKDIKEFYIL